MGKLGTKVSYADGGKGKEQTVRKVRQSSEQYKI